MVDIARYYLITRGFSEETTSMLVRGFMEVRFEGLLGQLRKQIEVAMDMAAGCEGVDQAPRR